MKKYDKIMMLFLIITVMVFITGCSSSDKDTVSSDDLSHLNTNLTDGESGDSETEGGTSKKEVQVDKNIDLSHTIEDRSGLKLFKDELPNDFLDEIGEEKKIDGGYVYITKEYSEVRSFEEQVVFTKSDIIYPGAIFKGDALINNEYVPLNIKRNPIDISLSLMGNVEVKGHIADPRVVSSAREGINTLLNQEGFEGPATLTFSVKDIESSNQFSLELGAGIGIGPVSLGFGLTPSSDTSKSSKFAQFTQRYYSIGVDRPVYTSDFFSEDVTTDEFLKMANGYMPVYVSNVIYGRRGVFQIDTEFNSETLEKEFTVGLGADGLGVSGSVKDTVTQAISTSEMKLYILGGDGDSAVKSISSYDDFVNHIKSGGKYSSSNRGEIIGFELRYLHDDSLAKTVVNEKYKVTEKIPRNKYVVYKLNYVEAIANVDSQKVNVKGFDLYQDNLENPLYKSIRKIFSISNNSRISLDQIIDTKIAGGTSHASSSSMVAYVDPQNDTVKFSGFLSGEFSYNIPGKWVGGTKNFTYNFSQVFNVREIEGNSVTIKVENFENPSYSFNINISTDIIYEDKIDEVFKPVMTVKTDKDSIDLTWSRSELIGKPYAYIVASQVDETPSYPENNFTTPDYYMNGTDASLNSYKKFEPGTSKKENFSGLTSGETYFIAITVVYDNGITVTSDPVKVTMP